MSIYRFAKTCYRRIRLFGAKDDVELAEYLEEFKEKFGGILDKAAVENSDKTLLVHSSHNLTYCMNIEGILAKAIQLKFGWKVIFLCDLSTKALAKEMLGGIYGFKNFCVVEDYISIKSPKELRQVLVEVDKAESLKEIQAITLGSIPVGLHGLATFSGMDSSGNVELNYDAKSKLKKIIRGAVRQAVAAEKILSVINPDLVLSVEKGTIGTCEIFYHSLNRDIDYVQYSACHEPNSLMLKRYNITNRRMHPFSVSDQSWNRLEYKDWMSAEVREAFENGYEKGDWFKYKNLTEATNIVSKKQLIDRLNLDPDKKIAIIFSHILNDANFYYGEDLFDGGFKEWLVKTVEVAQKNSNVNWIIKLHPANMFRRRHQNYDGEFGEIIALKEYLGEVPENIKIIPADISVNPYSFFMLADYAVTVRGTVGAELPCFGVPVITAGTGRYSNKGFTLDSRTVEEYLSKIRNIHLIERLSDEQIKIANKHAYLFFRARPARYDGFLRDTYPSPGKTIISRDVEPANSMIWSNQSLAEMAKFLAASSEEDYLSKLNT